MVSFLSDTLHDNPFYLWHTHRSRNTWNVGWDWGGGGGTATSLDKNGFLTNPKYVNISQV